MVLVHKIIFFDHDWDNIKTYWKNLADLPINLIFRHGSFEKIINKEKMQIVVAPTNSYVSMTGGIDKIYTKIFKNIETKLRKKISEKKYQISGISYKGTHYTLPIGKTIICETGNDKCFFIMASPTMVMPKDINGTNNIYLCMKAILKKISKINTPIIIACPCLGTGIGNVPAEESALQIRKALLEII